MQGYAEALRHIASAAWTADCVAMITPKTPMPAIRTANAVRTMRDRAILVM